MIKKLSILAFAFAVFFTSCSDIVDELTGGSDGLKVEVVDSAGYASNSTRAAYSNIIHTDFETGDAIGVYAYNTDGELVSSNVKFTKQSDGSWTSDGKVIYNPDYKYYGYFPYNSDAYTPNISENLDTKFADFIIDKGNKFWKRDQSTKANYDASNLMVSLGVVKGDKTIKFTMEHKRGLAVFSGAKNQWYYSTDANTMLPTSVTVVPVKADSIGNYPYDDNTNSYFLTKPDTTTNIGGLNWRIDEGKYMVYTGTMLTGMPKSYEYSVSSDGGNTWSDFATTSPTWLTVTTHVTEGSATNFSVTPAATKTTNIVVQEPDAELQNATAANDVDLSYRNNDGSTRSSRTTANCYLVHAPGTYRLPLVYGNAIANGSPNPSAYHTTQGYRSPVSMLQNFVNHKGDGIWTGNDSNDPWISTHGITVDGAKLIWQDVKGLISAVGISGSYLTFTVSKNNIAEGNAVIAATANGTVVWSWHIWVTKQTLRQNSLTAVATDSITYNVAPVNLGFAATTYEGSKCRVRAIASSGLAVQFQLQQPKAQSDVTNTLTNTYYEWGRKDPEPPQRGAYDIDGNAFNMTSVGGDLTMTYQGGILHPEIHYYEADNRDGYSMYADLCNNLWNADDSIPYFESRNGVFPNLNEYGRWYDAKKTTKTVYDPCPPDFCVPTGYLVDYLGYYEHDDNFNITYDRRTLFTRHDLYYEWTGGSPHLYFPMSGERDKDGIISYIFGNVFYIYTSTPYYTNVTRPEYYGAEHLQSQDETVISTNGKLDRAFPVRPVYEPGQ